MIRIALSVHRVVELGVHQGDQGVRGFWKFKRTFSFWDGFPTSISSFYFDRFFSGLLGTTAVGPNVNVTAQQIRQILVEFGVSGSDGPPIDIRTDAATDVGELLRRLGMNWEFTLSRAGPQEHNVIGSAERGVREVKEAIAVVRLELAKHQLDIVDSLVGWDGICRYVVAMRNLHGKKFGKTPRELLRDSPASKENPVSAMFVVKF